MVFSYISEGIDALVIDEFYSEAQLKEIMLELKWLTKPSILSNDKGIGAAKDLNTNNLITSKHGVFLEDVFKNWRHSSIITHTISNTQTEEFKSKMLSYNPLFKSFFQCDARCHLLSYYENADYYKEHVDSFFFTMLSYFNTEPKQFDGGEIVLNSCNSSKTASIEPRNNRVVIIASATPHEVKEISSKLKNTFSGDGRYCIASFLSVMPKSEGQNDSN